MVGADCLLRDSAAEDGESAVVAGDWGDHWRWVSDQVHDGFLSCRDYGRRSADARAAVFGKRVVLERNGAGICDLSAELSLANAAWIHLAAFSATHSLPRCGRRNASACSR